MDEKMVAYLKARIEHYTAMGEVARPVVEMFKAALKLAMLTTEGIYE